jgi:hypothetical protein
VMDKKENLKEVELLKEYQDVEKLNVNIDS